MHNTEKPKSALLTEADMALFVDYYQLTMGQADFDAKNDAVITANYYVRPFRSSATQGQYLIAAGLEQVIHYVLNLRFTDDVLNYLARRGDLGADYLASLRDFRFDGSVFAVPEGSLVFPNEPIINVTGRSRDVQLFETYLLCVMNFQTLISTKASRIVYAARGRPVFDFGARRAHARDAGVLAARAAFIGGASGTSLVLGGYLFDIPYVGTMAHKFILERSTEVEAFREYAVSFPHNTTFLIDTYNTLDGARHACIVAKEMEARGERLRAVRLDSGELLSLSKAVRHILDGAGLHYVEIVASDELDEFRIDALLKKGAPLDGFGVGTRLVTGANFNSLTGEGGPSALGGVYKLVERDGVPVGKLTLDEPAKATLPGRKQITRVTDADGYFCKDYVTLWPTHPEPSPAEPSSAEPSCDEPSGGERSGGERSGDGLLIPIVVEGELVYDFPNLGEIQAHARAELARLPVAHKRLRGAVPYDVELHRVLDGKPAQGAAL